MTNEELQALVDPKLYQLESALSLLMEEISGMRETLYEHKRLSLLTGKFGSLAGALRYHHQIARGWEYLIMEGNKPEHQAQLYQEFVQLRQVVIHYEYVIQSLLGISPSPGVDYGFLPEDKQKSKQELFTHLLGLLQHVYEESLSLDGNTEGWSSVSLYYQQELDRLLQTPRGKAQEAALERLVDQKEKEER